VSHDTTRHDTQRFSEQQIPVSVISAPQDEWRQTLKARRRISIVPKRFIHGTGRKWVRTCAHAHTPHTPHTLV
jgi:hypothetical protein